MVFRLGFTAVLVVLFICCTGAGFTASLLP